VSAQEAFMAKNDRIQSGILGDISTAESAKNDRTAFDPNAGGHHEDIEAMEGGSRHDRTEHSGSRDVTEGVTGGLGTETGGTRNYRTGTGATGGDIGNRPE
jgi:hypothetical protein